jgi:hypothetical protein
MAYWQEYSLGIAPQSAFGTENATTRNTPNHADFRWIEGDRPKVQFNTDKVELDLMTGQIGAAPERLWGRRSGTISFSMPLEGMKSTYDPTALITTNEVVPHWLPLVGNALGSKIAAISAENFWKGAGLSNAAYTAAGVAGAAGVSTVTMASALAFDATVVGDLFVSALAASTNLSQVGYLKTKAATGGPPIDTWTLTLLDPAVRKVDDNAANVYPASNAWLSPLHGNQLPLTMLYVGDQTESAYVLQDCICQGFKITWESGAVPTIEFTYRFYEYTADKTLGGLHVPTDHTRIPQIVGVQSGQACVGGAVAGGLEACTIEYTTELVELKSHSATQGISGVIYKKPRVKISVTVPWLSGDEIYSPAGVAGNLGSHKWQSKMELGNTVQLGCYVGPALGRIFAFAVPAALIVETPQVTEVGGGLGYQLTMEAGAYTGDVTIKGNGDPGVKTTSATPVDSLFRVSVA